MSAAADIKVTLALNWGCQRWAGVCQVWAGGERERERELLQTLEGMDEW